MSRRVPACVRVAGATLIVAVIGLRLGAGPFLTGLRSVRPAPLLAACGITIATTACCAYRWRLVARALGVPLRLRTAVTAYYRSQFLNVTVPGGVVGDVHRGIAHGRDVRNLGRALRSVLWERLAGQAAQLGLTAAVLVVLASPVRGAARTALAVFAAGVVAGLLVAAARRRRPRRRAGQRPTLVDELRTVVAAPAVWPRALACSVLAVCGHVLTFLVAARAVGVTAPLAQLVPLITLVLLAASLPLNLAGWGPREGVAAWAFAAAGLGGAQGAAASTAYGLLVTVASLPGAVIVVAGAWPRRRRPSPALYRDGELRRSDLALAATEGVRHG